MKPQTAFIVVSVVLLLAVLLMMYVVNNKNKVLLAENVTPQPVPSPRRETTQLVYNSYPQEYLNSFGNNELIRAPRPTIVGNTYVCPKGWKWSPADRACVPGGFGA